MNVRVLSFSLLLDAFFLLTFVSLAVAKAFLFNSPGDYSVIPVTRFHYRSEDGKPVPIDAEFDSPHMAKLSGSLKSKYVEKREEHWAQKRAEGEQHRKRASSPSTGLTALWERVKRRWQGGAPVGSLRVRSEEKQKEEIKKRELMRYEIWKRETFFANCTAAQEEVIQTAAYIASLYVADAEKYLTLNTRGTDRFETWFGTYQDDHHAAVLEHFTNMRRTDVKTYTYDCACEDGDDIYGKSPSSPPVSLLGSLYIRSSVLLTAYVYPTLFGHVYLCGQFMAAPLHGTDSKAGTMVHEASHFIENAGTLDIAYSTENAQFLALSDPSQAIMNADSHEYFAENDPYRL